MSPKSATPKPDDKFSSTSILMAGAGVGIFAASLLALIPIDIPKIVIAIVSIILAALTWGWGYKRNG